MSSRSGYSVPPRHYENSGQHYSYYNSQQQPVPSSSRYSSGDMPKLLAASYYESSPDHNSPANNALNAAKKGKKKKKKKAKLTREELLYLNDEELFAAEARAKEKKKKKKKHKDHMTSSSDIPSSSPPPHVREGYSPPRKKPRELVECERDTRRHSESRSPYIPNSRSPAVRDSRLKKIDIPSAYAEKVRSPCRTRHRSSSRSPNTIELNQKRERIRKKLAALNREEEKIEEQKRAKQAADEASQVDDKQPNDVRKREEAERRNIAIAAAGYEWTLREKEKRDKQREAPKDESRVDCQQNKNGKRGTLEPGDARSTQPSNGNHVNNNHVSGNHASGNHASGNHASGNHVTSHTSRGQSQTSSVLTSSHVTPSRVTSSEVVVDRLPVPPPPAKLPPHLIISPANTPPAAASLSAASTATASAATTAATTTPVKLTETVIPGFGDRLNRSSAGADSPNIDAILRSNREDSPENPHYRIDEEEGIKQFKILDKIGEGTYGQVYKARHTSSGDIVALKKVRCDTGKEDNKNKEGFPITAVREIKILKQLQHKNIISLKAIVTERLSAEDYRRSDASIYLVFEYMDHDLVGLLDSGLVKFDEREIKLCMRQLFEGLAYCHSKNFLHRDIKCANVLLNNKGEVKLADLGLARYWRQDDPQRLYTNKVITRWYRPPELLLGEEHYGPAVDIWSSGCILGEMFAKRALFRARSDQEQLDIICRICGSPSPENWPGVIGLSLYSSLIEYNKKKYPRIVRKEYCYFPEDALDLVDKTLALDPDQRLSAEECLKHKFLSDVELRREAPMQLPSQDCHEMWSKLNKKKKRQAAAEGTRDPHNPPVPHNKLIT